MYMHPFDAKNVTVGRTACRLLLRSMLAHAGAGVRIVESVLPALSYGQSCWSTVDLQNLGDRVVIVEIEGHRSTGALVPLAGRPGVKVRLSAGESAGFRLRIDEDTASAWAQIRETIPYQSLSRVIAVCGVAECIFGNELPAAVREVAYPS